MGVYIGLILLGFGGLTLWAGWQMAGDVYADFGTNLQVHTVQLASQLVEPLEDGHRTEYKALIDASVQTLGGQGVLFDNDGNAIYITEGANTRRIEPGTYLYIDNPSGEPTVYAANQIFYEGQSLGVVQIALPQTEPQATVRERALGLAAAFVIVGAVGLGLSLWLITTMTRPLVALRDGALQMAEGDLTQRIRLVGEDEIGAVGTAFNKMAERVEAMVTEQRAFASNASHELRTPLTTVRLRTEALQMSLDDPELTATYVDEIDSEVKRMSNLVDDLMLLSRLDAKRLVAGSETIDAVRLLQVLQKQFERRASEKGIELLVSAEIATALIQANMNHLRVVYSNVIGNAIKYTQPEGTVKVALTQHADQLQLQVIDNGPGISSDDLPNIGKRFYRTDKARSREATPGTGLGLALAQSILDLYKGDFTITSDGLGKGTTVTVTWPLSA